MMGTPALTAVARAVVLSPISSMVSGDGPIHTKPFSSTVSAKAAFSARNP